MRSMASVRRRSCFSFMPFVLSVCQPSGDGKHVVHFRLRVPASFRDAVRRRNGNPWNASFSNFIETPLAATPSAGSPISVPPGPCKFA